MLEKARHYQSLKDSFMDKVLVADGCWSWTATKSRGYGMVWNPEKKRMDWAHRVSWEIFRGPLPADLDVLHRCDNPECTNPAHLFLGTAADNVQDMIAKGRCFRHVGVAHHKSKLTFGEVLVIRMARGKVPGTHLAKLFGTTPTTVSEIQLNQTRTRG